MKFQAEDILQVLDHCTSTFTFPMLDNGYVYPAATRLSAYRSEEDWALVIEIFGFSPRAGRPDTQVYTFGSRLDREWAAASFANPGDYANHLAIKPHDETPFVFPIEEGDWQDAADQELLAKTGSPAIVRGKPVAPPALDRYADIGVVLIDPARVHVFEYCRYLAEIAREDVLTTAEERRICVPAELSQIVQLEQWNHPDIAVADMPSSNETFIQLAQILTTGEVWRYQPTKPANTHWRNWPGGGAL